MQPVPVAVAVACLLLLVAFAWMLFVAAKPAPISRELREDLEVMRLEAMWDVPWPQEERS